MCNVTFDPQCRCDFAVQEAVEQLYWLNTHYFEEHDVESAGKKEGDVRDKMQQTLATLDSLQGMHWNYKKLSSEGVMYCWDLKICPY